MKRRGFLTQISAFGGIATTVLLGQSTVNLGTLDSRAAAAGDDSLSALMEKGYFTYGLEAQYRPFEFRDENNQIVGFDIDLANELAKRWGVEARPVDTNWATVIQTLYDGGFDFILGGMTATQERYEQVNFSVPYMDASSGLLVRAGDGIKSRKDLDGMVVGAGAGTPSIKQLELSANELKIAYDGDIKTYDDDAAAYEALKVKRIDVYASTLVSLLEFANQTPGFGVLPFRSKLWPAEYTSAAFRKEDEALRQKFDASILEMKQDGTLAEMQQKWFNRTFEPLPDTAPTW